jgi:hypothetical protein
MEKFGLGFSKDCFHTCLAPLLGVNELSTEAHTHTHYVLKQSIQICASGGLQFVELGEKLN